MNAFHICGAVLAGWALLISFLGVTKEGFPGSPGGARIVSAISVVLVLLAIGTAVYTSATEAEGPGEATAAVLPR